MIRAFTGLFLLVLVCLDLAKPCDTSELRKSGHLNIGVYIQTTNIDEAIAFHQALHFWSNVLDMNWHRANVKSCTVALLDEPASAFDLHTAAFYRRSNGVISFNPHFAFTKAEIYSVAVHELGHAFGLADRPESIRANRLSFMRAGNNTGNERLDRVDLTELQKRHRLRSRTSTSQRNRHLSQRETMSLTGY